MNPNSYNEETGPQAPLQPPQGPRPGPHRVAPNYKFSQEELRVLKECNRESFYQRCIPFGAALGAAAYYGVQSGYLNRHPRFGATPKVVVSVIVGYFIGKFSYQSKCMEKLMQLPGSPIGNMLRQKRQGAIHESLEHGIGPAMSLTPFSTPTESYSDVPNSFSDQDSRPQYDGLDDTFRPTIDSNPIYEEEMPPIQKHATTYEELRKKNREEYQQSRFGPVKGQEQTPPPQTQPIVRESYENEQQPKIRTNKYGDLMT